jgi:hypothetical protein
LKETRPVDEVLPLVGDGDEIDLLQEVERSFAIKLPRDLRHCHTVGDLYKILIASIPHAENGRAGCLAAKAYFALRRAIRKHDPGRVIVPSTELAHIVTGRLGDYRWLRRIKEETGLEMPALTRGTGADLLFLASISIPMVGCAAHGWTGTFIALPISFGLLAFQRPLRRFPTRLRTVRDLAQAVAALNVAALASPNEGLRKREIWPALEGVIRDNLDWSGSVLPTTRFFQEE